MIGPWGMGGELRAKLTSTTHAGMITFGETGLTFWKKKKANRPSVTIEAVETDTDYEMGIKVNGGGETRKRWHES